MVLRGKSPSLLAHTLTVNRNIYEIKLINHYIAIVVIKATQKCCMMLLK